MVAGIAVLALGVLLLLDADGTLDLRFKRKLDAFRITIDADGRGVDASGVTGGGEGASWIARGQNEELN